MFRKFILLVLAVFAVFAFFKAVDWAALKVSAIPNFDPMYVFLGALAVLAIFIFAKFLRK